MLRNILRQRRESQQRTQCCGQRRTCQSQSEYTAKQQVERDVEHLRDDNAARYELRASVVDDIRYRHTCQHDDYDRQVVGIDVRLQVW